MKQHGITDIEVSDEAFRLTARIRAFYRRVHAERSDPASMWSAFDHGPRQAMHDLLMTGQLEEIGRALLDPASTYLFYGFDELFLEHAELLTKDPSARAAHQALVSDALARLSDAMGRPTSCPHEALAVAHAGTGGLLAFPTPFVREFGLKTDHGTISYRAAQSAYQAWRLMTLGGGRVLEIGAGLGRTAHQAYRLGMTDYTIVDLPLTMVAQAFFLGMAIGPDRVSLWGEPAFAREAGIRIAPPSWLETCDEDFDIALNADSMTEMSRLTATRYVSKITRSAAIFLSINHIDNTFTVADLMAESGHHSEPIACPMRDGYIEEIYRLSAPSMALARVPGLTGAAALI